MPVATHVEELSSAAVSPASFIAKTIVYSGREAVLSRTSQLEDLGAQCNQLGAMHGLGLLLNQDQTIRKRPHLVCLYGGDGSLHGAVLLFEYCWGQWGTGSFASGDRFGVRTVIADEALRFEIATMACRAMFARGARIVMVSFKWPHERVETTCAATPRTNQPWAVRTREVQDYLPLAATVDGTLACLGKRTRTHLRYYRRRLDKLMPCDFVQDAGSLIDMKQTHMMRSLNEGSLNPRSQSEFDLQFEAAASLHGGFISGLRNAEGRWLALVGGWRQRGTTWVQWQTNAAGFEEYSLGTALRSYLIDDEVARGSERLAFHGGTSHTMSHAFPVEQVVDLVAVQPGLTAHLLTRMIPWLYRRKPSLATRGNLLGDVLSGEGLQWFSEAELASTFDLKGDVG